MKLREILLFVFVTIIAATLLINAPATMVATREAIRNCMVSVVPSLMAFMIVTSFVSESSCGDTIGRILPTRLLFNLPRSCGKVVLLSMLGGYPCGAKMITTMLKKNEIDTKTAQRMLCFCINPSPAYVISAIGIGLFDNAKIGAIIWISHVFTALVIGIVFRGKPIAEKTTQHTHRPLSDIFVKSVLDSTNTMIAISGFVITFSVVLTFLRQTGVTDFATNALNFLTKDEATSRALFDTFFDVVVGSKTCLDCPPITAVMLCAGAVSFGGISIISQVVYLLSGQNIKFLRIILFRFVHAVLTVATVYIIINITDTEITTAILIGSNVTNAPTNYITTMLFVLCCACFLVVSDKNISTLAQRRIKQ